MTLQRTYKRGIGRVYVDNDNREYPSVTTVLGSTLAPGPWLEKWKKKLQREAFREQYEIRALEQGDGRVDVYDIFDESLEAPNIYRNSKGDLGTFYHHAIEAYLKGTPTNEYLAQDPRVEDVLHGVADWEEKHKISPVKIEHYIASKRWGFAGTIDLVAHTTRDHGKELVLVDWKTGSTQEDQKMQLAAYCIAYEETYNEGPNIAFFCKIDVEKATVREAGHIHNYEISRQFDLFLAAFKLWKHRTKAYVG